MSIRPMAWQGDHLAMLDQRALPGEQVWLRLESWESVRDAIRSMAVRGAPAIGIAAAYGMALAARAGVAREIACDGLASSRPTAVNLFWALARITSLSSFTFEEVLREAQAIEDEDLAMNLAIGRSGADLVPNNGRILTICNTGSLATAGHGTALGVIRTAYAQGKVKHVYVCETRPRQQGLKLTAWELQKDGIPFHVIPDSSSAFLMQKGEVDFIVAGADRIAANGDTVNKVGTLMLAVLASRFNLPFVVAAPRSTLDPSLPEGSGIPIEERDPRELTHAGEVAVAPDNCPVWNPSFDLTPGELITAIVTESGVHRPPFEFVG